MLTIESQVTVPGLTGAEITDFFHTCTDERYQAWWPGVHLHLHQLAAGGSDHVHDEWLMDELVGTRHVRMTIEVVAAEPGRKIVWQFKKGSIRLPVRLALELTDRDDGVAIRHTMTAGWEGPGRLLDPLWRLDFSPRFVTMLDQHVRTEFPRMRDLLHPVPTNDT
jgi:hypothetical protein